MPKKPRMTSARLGSRGKAVLLTATLTLAAVCAWIYRVHKRANGGSRVARLTTADSAEAASSSSACIPAASSTGSLHPTQVALELMQVYERMAGELQASNLHLEGIKAFAPWFYGLASASETPWPKKYIDFDEPLAAHAVRLLVVPLTDAPTLQAKGAAVTSSILQLLPKGIKVFANARTHYHCTMFHTSQPTDPRPDATREDGGVAQDVATGALPPPPRRRGPTQDELAHEQAVMRAVVAGTHAPQLQLERVLFAASGTLLLVWVDTTDHVQELRQRCRAAFPGASTRQAGIIHTTLLRILTPAPLPQECIARINAKCEEWTSQLRGQRFSPRTLWFVDEDEFSTVGGPKVTLPFKG